MDAVCAEPEIVDSEFGASNEQGVAQTAGLRSCRIRVTQEAPPRIRPSDVPFEREADQHALGLLIGLHQVRNEAVHEEDRLTCNGEACAGYSVTEPALWRVLPQDLQREGRDFGISAQELESTQDRLARKIRSERRAELFWNSSGRVGGRRGGVL